MSFKVQSDLSGKELGVPRGADAEKLADHREMQLAALKYDLSTAHKLRDVVIGELKNGVSPRWLAVKYGHLGATLERITAAKAAIDGAKRAKEEREAARQGSGNEP